MYTARPSHECMYIYNLYLSHLSVYVWAMHLTNVKYCLSVFFESRYKVKNAYSHTLYLPNNSAVLVWLLHIKPGWAWLRLATVTCFVLETQHVSTKSFQFILWNKQKDPRSWGPSNPYPTTPTILHPGDATPILHPSTLRLSHRPTRLGSVCVCVRLCAFVWALELWAKTSIGTVCLEK